MSNAQRQNSPSLALWLVLSSCFILSVASFCPRSYQSFVSRRALVSISDWAQEPKHPWSTQHKPGLCVRLQLSDIADSPDSSTLQGNVGTDESRTPSPRHLEFPWNEIQAWTLRDQLLRYTIQVPVTDSRTQESVIKVYALWRTLTNEVTELAGYPIPFLIERHQELVGKGDEESPSSIIKQTPTEILPFLDDFEFTTSGGLSGRVYGVLGVADGTRIETTPVGNVQVTVPKGFITTQDGLLYELGRPVIEPLQEAYSLDGTAKLLSSAAKQATTLSGSVSDSITRRSGDVWDPDLVQFGALTTLVIGGALAFETLQHHLTVNIFGSEAFHSFAIQASIQ